ncbi:MAG: flagellar basal body L-ring protein FlgH, partial [Melioribacteraceae bacterium]|nr:flagellar basal body L-ring protein FlgH [Melioribacteraceae bacterium]
SLFSDQKANRIGDAITIIVVEESQATNNAQTNAGRSSDINFSGSGTVDATALPNANLGLESGNEFKGSGGTKTTGMVRTKISATIDSVLANGNMRVIGSRKISINGEEQTISIRGIVRSADISAENTVLSYNISDAEITFEGSGIIDDAQQPGWLTKLFHWLF